jgi:hypothetical protein
MNDDPECTMCGHVSSDHPRGGPCGASVDDEDGNATRCGCLGPVQDRPVDYDAPALEGLDCIEGI